MSVCWSVGWSAGRLVGLLVGWLVWRLVGWLVGLNFLKREVPIGALVTINALNLQRNKGIFKSVATSAEDFARTTEF